MRSFILLAVFSSMIVSCKSVAREPESQPEFFGVVPKYVRDFLKLAKRRPNSIGRHSIREVYSSHEVLRWSAQHGKYRTFKKVVDGAVRHSLLKNDQWDLSQAIVFSVKSRDADKKIPYLIERGTTIDNAMLQAALVLDRMDTVPDLVRLGGNPNAGLLNAVIIGNLKVVRELVEELGASDVNTALLYLVNPLYKTPDGAAELARYLLERGATNVDEALEYLSVKLWRSADAQRGAAEQSVLVEIEKILTEALNNAP